MNLGAVVPQETAVLPLPLVVLPRRTKGKGKEGTGRYYRGGRAVLPHYCRSEVPHNPTQKKTPRIDAVGTW